MSRALLVRVFRVGRFSYERVAVGILFLDFRRRLDFARELNRCSAHVKGRTHWFSRRVEDSVRHRPVRCVSKEWQDETMDRNPHRAESATNFPGTTAVHKCLRLVRHFARDDRRCRLRLHRFFLGENERFRIFSRSG